MSPGLHRALLLPGKISGRCTVVDEANTLFTGRKEGLRMNGQRVNCMVLGDITAVIWLYESDDEA